MKHYSKIFLLIFSIFISSSIQSQKMQIDKSIVDHFVLNEYLGTWYEIARYDHSFERHLIGVTAKYSINDKGRIEVLNSGYKKTFDGKLSEAKGKAKISNPNTPAHLRVSFFLFFYSDYLILELDKNYEWAVVGSSSDKYLWILSRKPYLPNELYRQIIDKIQRRGYPTEELIKVKHNMDNYVELPKQ